jgi:hypothetical protein
MNTLTSSTPISDEELMAFAPSIFQESRSSERSERYSHIPTSIVHKEMTKAGFYPVKVIKSLVRPADHSEEAKEKARLKEAFSKHLVLYRHPDIRDPEGKGYYGQVGYVGDHAGKCSIQLFAGLLELLCGNGLIAGRVAEAIRIGHVKLNVVDVVNAAFKMMESIGRISEWRGHLQSIDISHESAVEFVREASLLRWEEGKAPIYPSQLLARRREGDTYGNLWGVYQLAEENMRRGGQVPQAANDRYWKAKPEEQRLLPRPKKVAPISALDATLKFEKSISDLADDWSKRLAKAA